MHSMRNIPILNLQAQLVSEDMRVREFVCVGGWGEESILT